jgi:hypothetical protein
MRGGLDLQAGVRVDVRPPVDGEVAARVDRDPEVLEGPWQPHWMPWGLTEPDSAMLQPECVHVRVIA